MYVEGAIVYQVFFASLRADFGQLPKKKLIWSICGKRQIFLAVTLPCYRIMIRGSPLGISWVVTFYHPQGL